jgi:hypothetical protein
VNEATSTPRPVARRGDAARETLFQRIDAIVGSIHPAEAIAEAMVPRTVVPRADARPVPSAVGAPVHGTTLTAAHVAHSQSSKGEADPVFGRLLERWFALERDRVLGEHLHLDQVKAVANAYAPGEPDLRVMR